MDCPKCKMGGIEGEKICRNCGFNFENNQIGKPAKAKNIKSFLISLAILIVIGIVSGVITEFRENKVKEEVETVFSDVINKTDVSSQENKEYVAVVTAILEHYKAKNSAVFKASEILEEPDFLELSSFKSKERMLEIVQDVKNYVKVFNQFEKQNDSMIQGAMDIVSASSLSSAEKEEFLSGFNKGLDNPRSDALRFEYVQSINSYCADVISLYEFLIANFNDYKIDFEENGEENIFFYSDEPLVVYHQYVDNIQNSSSKSFEAEAEYVEDSNKFFEDLGAGITYEELNEYYSN